MKRYKHLFFDLDHTLWDFRTNSRVVLRGLHVELGLAERGVANADELIEEYEVINAGLWERYEAGTIDKDVMRVLRFRNTLLRFGVKDDRLATRLGDEYLDRTPRMSGVHEGAHELLSDLRPHYGLHIITNGFEETQRTKLESSGLRQRVDHVITSERAGARKPDQRIFEFALRKVKTSAEESLMIGDSISADMGGARAVGMDHAHFAAETSPDPLATYRITRFAELRAVLLP